MSPLLQIASKLHSIDTCYAYRATGVAALGVGNPSDLQLRDQGFQDWVLAGASLGLATRSRARPIR